MAANWIRFPLSNQLCGMRFRIGHYTAGPQHLSLFSFGVIAALLALVAAWAFSKRRFKLLGWIGAAIIWLALYAALKVALVDAPLLVSLESEMLQQQSAAAFSLQALPVNYGSEPTIWPRVSLDSIEDRLIAAWYFVRFGWWGTLLAGTLALGFAISALRSLKMLTVTIAGIASIFVLCVLRPALAANAQIQGHIAETNEEPDAAIKHYRRAMQLDRWLAVHLELYQAIGSIHAVQGKTNTVEFGVYHAGLPSTQTDLLKAIAEYDSLIPHSDPLLAKVLRKREADLYTQYGRSMHALGAYGAAVDACEKALEQNPSLLLPAYFLSRDYYLLGHYQDAITLNKSALQHVGDPIFAANLYANLGDAYTKLGALSDARYAYRKSYMLDYLLNLRSLSALNGP